MNHWSFVTAAYSVALLATAGLLARSYLSMRKAESAAEKLKRPE